MGERGAAREPATPDDIAAMADLARDAVRAGALGFTTSRTLNHRSSRGELTPTLTAEADELVGIAEALGSIGAGVLQVVSDFIDLDGELELMHTMAARSGRPISISVAQSPVKPNIWRTLLDRMSESTAAGVTMRGQVGARAVGLLLGFEATLNPFMWAPAWADLAALPVPERIARLRRPDVRDALLGAITADRNSSLIGGRLVGRFDLMFPLGDPPNYEPDPSTSVAATAATQGREPAAVAYDLMLADDGHGLLYMPVLNFADGTLDAVHGQLAHPASVAGLSDGGAHVGTICDVSFPTTLLQWWGRDRPHTGCRSSCSCTSRHGRRPRRSACSIAASSPKVTAPTSTSSTSTRCACTSRSSPTTCRPADAGCCNVPTATSTRSSPAPKSALTASRPAPRPAGSCVAQQRQVGERRCEAAAANSEVSRAAWLRGEPR